MSAWEKAFSSAWVKRRFGADTTAFRAFHEESEQLEHVTVDVFGTVAILSLYAEFSAHAERELATALASALPICSVYLKRRPKEARNSVKLPPEELAPSSPLWGEQKNDCSVLENGARFLIRPSNGLNVGLYLDAREARQWVQRHAQGRSVLNCFSYTCGFGVAAQRGGALRTLNVDLSRKVLDWGQQNYALNGLQAEFRDFIAGDVFEWLQRLNKKPERFGLVVLDPPSFATTKGRRFSAARDYAELVALAVPLVEEGGILMSCCNLSTLSSARFRTWVLEACHKSGRDAKVEAAFGASAVDFPTQRGQESALKVLAVTIK